MIEKSRETLRQSYARYLATINQINFTFREAEIIACLLNVRGVKKIALLLNIAPKTVETHIRNINSKTNCSSQHDIIKFIENSGKLEIIKEFYKIIIQPDGQIQESENPSPIATGVSTAFPQENFSALAITPLLPSKNIKKINL